MYTFFLIFTRTPSSAEILSSSDRLRATAAESFEWKGFSHVAGQELHGVWKKKNKKRLCGLSDSEQSKESWINDDKRREEQETPSACDVNGWWSHWLRHVHHCWTNIN